MDEDEAQLNKISEDIVAFSDFKNTQYNKNKANSNEIHIIPNEAEIIKNKSNENENIVKIRNSGLFNNKFSIKTEQQLQQNNLKQTTPIIKDENLLRKIETTNKEKYLEVLREKKELENQESNLTMMQRLTHEKWQIRKHAFKQSADLIFTIKSNINKQEKNNINSPSGEAEQELIETMETLFPWFKYLITETNVIALCEGLNSFCFLMDFCSNEQKNKALILFFDELEKLIMHNKSTINDLCLKIVLNVLRVKKFANFVINEIIRELNTNNNKLLMFFYKCVEEMLDDSFSEGAYSEHYLKLLFEKVVFYFSQQQNKNIERKKIYGKIINSTFEKITDDLETVKHYLNLGSDDLVSIEKLLYNADKEKKEQKKNIFKYRLYEAIRISKNQGDINKNTINNRDINLRLKTAEVNFDPSYYPNIIKNKNLVDLNLKSSLKENKNGLENDFDCNAINENIDLFTILPSEFSDIPYITALKVKKEILDNVNKKLMEITSIKEKNYKDFLNIVNHAIADTNILINLEGIKILKNFCKLSKSSLNQSKLKNLVISCYEKFKDKKTNVKMELFDLFNIIIVNQIFSFEYFFIFKLRHIITQKNPVVKINLLEYIKETFRKYDKSITKDNKNDKTQTKGNFETKLKNEKLITRINRNKSVHFRNKLNGIKCLFSYFKSIISVII
jgi:hypothetical protein